MKNKATVFAPWRSEIPPLTQQSITSLLEEADVIIVGSGYTGLSAALTLLRSGKNVLVLEADAAGYGASTRNGGQIGSGNQKFKVQTLVDQYGKEKARALVNAGTEMLGYIDELIRAYRMSFR